MTCGQSGVAMGNLWLLLAAGGVMAAVIGCLTLLNNRYTLNNIMGIRTTARTPISTMPQRAC